MSISETQKMETNKALKMKLKQVSRLRSYIDTQFAHYDF